MRDFNHSAQMKFYVLMCFAMLSTACAKLTPSVNVCFSPGGDCISSITAEIENAKTEILIQAY